MPRSLTKVIPFAGLSALVSLPTLVFAHETSSEAASAVQTIDAEAAMRLLSFETVGIASAVIVFFVLVAIALPKKSDLVKNLLFWPIALTTVATTLMLAYLTINLNINSWSRGPIHWHADLEVWACGAELDLVDPQGLSNKIGSPSRHEHNDKRLHYEGVVVEPSDASLANFVTILGGELTLTTLSFPTNDGDKHYHNGDSCGAGQSGGVVNVFVYSTNDDDTYSQRKISDPETYIIRDDSQVPPGDCIIVEFGQEKDRTDKLCRSYKVAQEIGKLNGEVPYGD